MKSSWDIIASRVPIRYHGRVLGVLKACLREDPEERATMQEVLDILPSMKDIVVEEQEWYLRKLFHLIDDDNSNSIDKTELLEAMDKREVRGEYTY